MIVAQLLFVIPMHQYATWGYLTVAGGFCALVSFFWASCSDPGYLKPEHRFEELLKEVHPCEMCPDCEVIRSSRSKHCAICNHCVERYDHHCPWINNCVGTGNHNAFLSFIYFMTITLTIIIISSALGYDSKVYERHPDQWAKWQQNLCDFTGGHQAGDPCTLSWVRDLACTVSIVICCCFFFPVAAMCQIHSKNFCMNKTTNERYSR